KLHQSPMIGEVLAGILLGPMVLGLINPDPTTSFGESLNVVANLGVFILVLLAGIELGREGLRKAFKERSMVVAIVEFFLPFSLGYSLAAALGLTFSQSLFLGTAMAVTALPVSVRILLDLNLLNSRLGRAIVSVALVNDLVAFAMLGLVVQFTSLGTTTPEGLTIGLVALNNVLFVGLVFCVATILKLTTHLGRNSESYMQTLVSKLRGQEASFALCISTALGLNARGMMELLLAQVGLATGIIDTNLYSALVIMTLTTTLCTPPILKRLLRRFTLDDVLPRVPRALAVGGIESSSLIPSDETAR